MNEELEEGKQLAIQLVEHMRDMGAAGLCIPIEVEEQGLMDGERVWVAIQTDTARTKDRAWVELGKNSGEIQKQRATAHAELAEMRKERDEARRENLSHKGEIRRRKREHGEICRFIGTLDHQIERKGFVLNALKYLSSELERSRIALAESFNESIQQHADLTAAESERDGLRAAVENAPHAASCAVFQPFAGLGKFNCDCWKATALEASK